ncbi:MAG TPA: peptidase S10 [Candidatus Sulfotelmatobacter sp.]|nr:peptidase S10 [Candidatus Sulfotelmatobacter sp.]
MNPNFWTRMLCAALLFSLALSTSLAQEKETKPAEKSSEAAPAPPPKEESSVTEHSIKIGGQTVPYKATAGTIFLKNEKDENEALIYYTAYTRSDVKDLSQRPLAFLYNGGPGSSSIWLHMGSFGPKRVVTVNADITPPAPYKLEDNPDCLLDRTDLVFIDPVGTGFSKAVGKAQDKDFWGVDQDARSLAQFVQSYVTRNNRWNSPKFLIGESYGTFRNAALANLLQSRNGIYLNGIVMVSSVWDLGTLSFYPGVDLAYILYLPSYAATAWYHKVLKDHPDNLPAFLDEARKFAKTEYADALLKGDTLSAAERSAIAKKLEHFTGLSEDYILKSNLRVKLRAFMQELQRNRGLTTGRLDARFSGPTYDLIAAGADYDPQSTAITGAFTAAFNMYVREDLKFGHDRDYHVSAHFGDNHWDWKHETGGPGPSFFPGTPNVMRDLANAIITNPKLQVEMEDGYYDLATPFLEAEYATEHLGLPENLQKNIHHKYYEAGHMMYLRTEDLAKLKANVAAFIDSTSKTQ